ncbi:MAG: hypothetical protein ACSHX0_09920 [Akkermansiaceae bacterium]
MNNKFTTILILTLLLNVLSAEERFKTIRVSYADLKEAIIIDNENSLFIDLFISESSSAQIVQLNCMLFLNVDKIEVDQNLLLHQRHKSQIFPHYYLFQLKSGEFYRLSFVKDSRNFRRYTELANMPAVYTDSSLELYFKDYNNDGKADHLTIKIDMMNFNWASGKSSKRRR